MYEAFLGRYEEYRHFFHGHTYTGNPLGCAAALATLRLLGGRRASSARSRRRPSALRAALAPVARHPHVGEVRQLGLMCGIELVADRATEGPLRSRRPGGATASACAMRDHGFFVRPLGDVIVLVLAAHRRRRTSCATWPPPLHAVLVERFGG